MSMLILALLGFSLSSAILELRQENKGLHAIKALRLVLIASEMASRERGPANGVMGDSLPHDPAKLALLKAARQRTDQAFTELQTEIRSHASLSDLGDSLQRTQAQLLRGRLAVDRVAERARADRTPERIRTALAEMFQVVDGTSPASLLLTRDAQLAFPNETNKLLAARIASDLREQAGRLGSALTVTLTRREHIETDDFAAFEQTIGHVNQLNASLLERIHDINGVGSIANATSEVQHHYFEVAMPYIQNTLAIGLQDADYPTDAAGFAHRYVPEMDSIVELRNVLLDHALQSAQLTQADTRRVMYVVMVAGLGATLLLASIVLLLHFRVGIPSRQAIDIILQIASGNFNAAIPKRRHQDEVSDIFHAITVLRNNSLERLRLQEERLKLSEDARRAQEALDAVDSYIFLKDAEGRYLYANKATRNLLGRPLREIVGQTDEKFFDMSSSDDLRRYDRHVIESGERIRKEERSIIAATNEIRYFWTEKSPLKDADGQTVGLIGISTDITPKKHVEHALIKAQQETAAANSQLSSTLKFVETILLNTPLPMGVYAEDGQCVQANEAYASFAGATREQLLSQNFRQSRSFAASGLLDSCMDALRTNEPQRHETSVITSFGKELFCEYRILPTNIEGQWHLLIQFIDLSERRRLEEKLRQMAFHDALTHLPNRRSFIDAMQKSLRARKRTGAQLAVLFLDLNRFKLINDTHGHDAGDLLLIEVAHRLQALVRETDTVARLGGDEFVVLLEMPGASAEQARETMLAIAQKIDLALAEDYVLGDIRHQGSASIGVTLVGPDDDDVDLILAEADTAMYQVKRRK
ncbi:MAG: diguanylate cyclase [Burkholderiaceae bacterium]|nr:diguanylate cyclase [Burkholderiaceae bacterium]